jgi:integrase
MSRISRCCATFNRVTMSIAERAKEQGLPIAPFTVHDLRRTGSTLLNEIGFESDWIEKCLAHVDRRTSRRVYNVAEYAHQRRHMQQEWADMIDAWARGESGMSRPFGSPSCMGSLWIRALEGAGQLS